MFTNGMRAGIRIHRGYGGGTQFVPPSRSQFCSSGFGEMPGEERAGVMV